MTSRTIIFGNGAKKTIGIMQPGEYEFNTGKAEIMEIMTGDLDVLLPGQSEWKKIKSGESFHVSANSKFKMRVKSLSDYCCSFVD